MLALATTQQGDIPLFLRPLVGNSSDQVSLLAAVEALQKQLHAPEDEQSIYVADSGIYSEANMRRLNVAQLPWIGRVVLATQNICSQKRRLKGGVVVVK